VQNHSVVDAGYILETLKVARCGRCGLWSEYPENHPEQEFRGVCVYYQLRLREDDVFAQRKCPDFFERVPEWSVLEHFGYKMQRDGLGDAFKASTRAKRIAYVSLALSIGGVLTKAMSALFE